MEQLQNLIVRRSSNNGVARQEIIAGWMKIQREVDDAINQMDKLYEAKVDALSFEEKARHQSLLGSGRKW
jgi:hypothetical protein